MGVWMLWILEEKDAIQWSPFFLRVLWKYLHKFDHAKGEHHPFILPENKVTSSYPNNHTLGT